MQANSLEKNLSRLKGLPNDRTERRICHRRRSYHRLLAFPRRRFGLGTRRLVLGGRLPFTNVSRVSGGWSLKIDKYLPVRQE